MIEILFTSSVLIIVICLLRLLLKGKMNLKLQYALWLLVVIRLLPFNLIFGNNLPQIESKVSIMNLLPTKEGNDTAASQEIHKSSDAIVEERDSILSQPADWISNGFVTQENFDKKGTAPSPWILLYSLGALTVGAWFLFVNIKFAGRLKKNRSQIKEIDCSLPVYSVHNLKVSCVYIVGGKCGIYLSQESAANPEQVRYIVAHEICHYKHRDHIWSILRCLFVIGYWFDPLVWLAAFISKRDCEMACDTAVIKNYELKERLTYGKTIVDLADMQRNYGTVMNLATYMSEDIHGLKERIQHIVKRPRMLPAVLSVVIIIMFSLVITTFTVATKKVEVSAHVNVESPTVKEYVETYLHSGKEDYLVKNKMLDEFFTNHPSISYDRFTGVERLSKITATEDTILKGVTKAKGDAACLVLILPSKEWIVLDNNAQFEVNLPKGETTLLLVGDADKGNLEINYDSNELIHYSPLFLYLV